MSSLMSLDALRWRALNSVSYELMHDLAITRWASSLIEFQSNLKDGPGDGFSISFMTMII